MLHRIHAQASRGWLLLSRGCPSFPACSIMQQLHIYTASRELQSKQMAAVCRANGKSATSYGNKVASYRTAGAVHGNSCCGCERCRSEALHSSMSWHGGKPGSVDCSPARILRLTHG
jgi:hypothetical protein